LSCSSLLVMRLATASGELRGELVHVGELVRHRRRDLLAARPLGDAGANRLGQGQLAAEVVSALRRDAEVGADGGDPVGVERSGARLPAVSELLLQVGERELLALLAVGLEAPDLLRRRGVVEHSTIRLRTGSARPCMYSLPARPWLALAAR
jgi:hypothetical protein